MKDPFIYIPEMELSFSPENEITTPTEFKVVEFDSTDPGINTDEGFFFFNLKTKHCGEFLYRTGNKKAFVDFGNQLEKNHKGPYRIEVIKNTNYICSTPELYDPDIHETQNNLIDLETKNKIIDEVIEEIRRNGPICDSVFFSLSMDFIEKRIDYEEFLKRLSIDTIKEIELAVDDLRKGIVYD